MQPIFSELPRPPSSSLFIGEEQTAALLTYPFMLRRARGEDLPAIRDLAQLYRDELGFVHEGMVHTMYQRGVIIVALDASEQLVGFVSIYIRQDGVGKIYQIAVHPDWKHRGVGRALMEAAVRVLRSRGCVQLQLKCPLDLPANQFYRQIGLELMGMEEGVGRPLMIWGAPLERLRLLRGGKFSFVVAATGQIDDLERVVQAFREAGIPYHPCTHIIMTPLFMKPQELELAQSLKDRYGAVVFFDSGGYQVQTGRITYHELFQRLAHVYRSNPWADWFVMPDHVLTSKDTNKEAEDKIRDTIHYTAEFLDQMPELRPKALAAVHGRTEDQLQRCLSAYAQLGLRYIGFGGFETAGPEGSVNVISAHALRRLSFVSRFAAQHHMRMHVFGLGGTTIFPRLFRAGIWPDTLDSSGWRKAAAYGKVFWPARPQTRITQLAPQEAERLVRDRQEQSGHICPFCRDPIKLSESHWLRSFHNLVCVFETIEMVRSRMLDAIFSVDLKEG